VVVEQQLLERLFLVVVEIQEEQDYRLLPFLVRHQKVIILLTVQTMEHQFVVNLQVVVQEDTIFQDQVLQMVV
tara:strand:- start:189 stop:407 length:219 start_codon:yes stop_codon:yes gene_type:complete